MKGITVNKCIVGKIKTNCYIINNNETKECIITDPGDDVCKVVNFIKENELIPVAILLTHGHFDHILAVKELADTYKISVYAGEEEKNLLENSNLNFSEQFGAKTVVTPDVLVKDEECLTLGNMKLKVIHTPGHTSGSVCYYFYEDNILLTGDTLFREGIGRTDFPTGDSNEIIKSLENLMLLKDDVAVMPGHGSETSILHERKNNDSYKYRI